MQTQTDWLRQAVEDIEQDGEPELPWIYRRYDDISPTNGEIILETIAYLAIGAFAVSLALLC